MRLLVFNMAMDLDDPVLEFATSWIRALAKHSEYVFVLTMRAGRVDVPGNVKVYSVGKEKGYSELRRTVEFYRLLRRILSEGRIDACFSHMIPIFTVLGGPILRTKGIPVVTWYAHPRVTPTLKISHHLSTRVATSAPESYRYRKDKVIVLGQGIDTEHFAPDATSIADPPLVLAVGRISPVKDLITLIRAVRRVRDQGRKLTCAIVGGAPGRDRLYAAQVVREVKELGLEEYVRFIGPQSQSQVLGWYRRCFVYVNCSPANHSLDKTVLEAMACGRPILTSIKGFESTLDSWAQQLTFRQLDPEDLAVKLQSLFAYSQESLLKLGQDLRQSTVQHHSLSRFSDRLVNLLGSLTASNLMNSEVPR
jgi:glycosyltransferase involved in cell wall biosynthesis